MTGGAAHPDFTLIYPYHTNNHIAKVMTYACKYTHSGRKQANPIHTIPHLDLALHPTILIMDHYVNHLRIVNFYDDSLQSLLTLTLDSTFPTIHISNFNLRSHSL